MSPQAHNSPSPRRALLFNPASVFIFLSISALLLAVSCSKSETSSASQPAQLTAQQVRGQRLFQANCAICHHADTADPLNGPGLKGVFRKPYLPSGAPANDERVHEVLKMGRRNMPPFGMILDDRQMDDVIAYLHSL